MTGTEIALVCILSFIVGYFIAWHRENYETVNCPKCGMNQYQRKKLGGKNVSINGNRRS